MFLNQLVSFGRATSTVTGLAVFLTLGGCSLFSRGDDGSQTVAPPVASSSEPVAREEQQTVTEALGDLQEGETATVTDNAGAFSASAPRNYVVQRGDTLWGLANMFLRDPWLWPEIWYVNPQVRNPHLIYPGDTLALAYGADGKPSLQLTRGPGARLQPMLRSTALGDGGPIATIPYEAIRAFLSRPGIVTKAQAKSAPYVLAIRDAHLIAGADHDLYVKKLTAGMGERFNIMHVDAPLRDPEDGDMLGYMAVYSGTGQVTRPGNPATVNVNESAREILAGDILLSESGVDAANIVPRAPTRAIDGQVMGVVNGVLLVGQYQVIALNRGANHGVEVGHVLKVREGDKSVRDRCARINGSGTCSRFRAEALPNEASGTVLVFKTYERMSYALVVAETTPIHINDRFSNP
jgi:LysM repeat protein